MKEESLHWNQRPEFIKLRIDQAYEQISSNPGSQWGVYNGSGAYNMAGIPDELLIEKILLDGISKGQKKFTFMDIGAGNFQWGKNITQFINTHPLFSKEQIEVSIFNLRGEKEVEQPVVKEGVCTNYNYGSFKVENLEEEFKKRGHNLTGQVDFMVSSWCFRHLVDPTGTLLQAYEQLKPETGIILLDGFFREISGKEPKNNLGINLEFASLLLQFRSPFFQIDDTSLRRAGCFFMQKSNNTPMIPYQYKDLRTGVVRAQIGSECITVFEEVKNLNRELREDFKPKIQESNYNGKAYISFNSAGQSLCDHNILDHSIMKEWLIKNIQAIEKTGVQKDYLNHLEYCMPKILNCKAEYEYIDTNSNDISEMCKKVFDFKEVKKEDHQLIDFLSTKFNITVNGKPWHELRVNNTYKKPLPEKRKPHDHSKPLPKLQHRINEEDNNRGR